MLKQMLLRISTGAGIRYVGYFLSLKMKFVSDRKLEQARLEQVE